MATNVITTCDFARGESGKSHGVPATMRFTASLDGKGFEADLCDTCAPELQRALTHLGVRPAIALVDGKPRGAYVSASGRAFSTAEAREWLISEGYDVNPIAGRISKELLATYAAAH